jgi:hypothetical protein
MINLEIVKRETEIRWRTEFDNVTSLLTLEAKALNDEVVLVWCKTEIDGSFIAGEFGLHVSRQDPDDEHPEEWWMPDFDRPFDRTAWVAERWLIDGEEVDRP